MAGIAKTGGMSPVRKKQVILLTGLVAIVGAIALAAGMLGTPKKQVQTAPKETTRKAFGAQGEQVNANDIWRTQEGARVSALQGELEDLKKSVMAREKAEANAKKMAEDEAARKAEQEKLAREREKEEMERRARTQQPPPNGLQVQGSPPGIPGGVGPNPGFPSGEQGERVKGIMRVDLGGTSATGGADAAQAAKNGAMKNQPGAPQGQGGAAGADVSGASAETYLPAGSFMRGVLLAGLDAPTGGQSQQNPHPVLIEVLDMASLPNKFKADYKSCRIVGNGVGDLSSERAYIRLDRLSCITEDGGAIDVGIKGFVADQTGKNGIRGRLVSKQGTVLANALLAGVAAGMGQAFTQSNMTSSVSPLGSTQTVDSGKEFQAGIGQGVGNAMNQLSKYYITLAEKLFPIIEVDAGQPVDIVLTKGLSVARK